MNEYIFTLGKNPHLSIAELRSVFHDEVKFERPRFALIETIRKVDQTLLNQLGGTVKIGEVFHEQPLDVLESASPEGKILFGVSQLGGHEPLSKTLLFLKRELQKRGRTARFLNKDYKDISSSQLTKAKILENGVDLTRCFIEGKETWARTIAVQDIDAYSLRDYGKPCRDMMAGMMPPKLAQIMINLAEPEEAPLENTFSRVNGDKLAQSAAADLRSASPKNSRKGIFQGGLIYDPFCGVGTISLEAALRGNPTMGSDIKRRMVDMAQKNMYWLMQAFHFKTPEPFRFFQHDARMPFPEFVVQKDLCIVTEGYLGPLQTFAPDERQQQEIFLTIHEIYEKFFAHAAALLAPKKTLVITFPFFRIKETRVFYSEPYLRQYENTGFTIKNPLRSLLYERETQVVGREIVLLIRK